MFNRILYLKIESNKVTMRDPKTQREVSRVSVVPFTTEHLLAGNFTIAEAAIKDLSRSFFTPGFSFVPGFSFLAPRFVVHPLEMTEGGLSQVEERLFEELGRSSGARSVKLHVGNVLSDQELANFFR